MSYVNPAIRAKFDSMPPELREHILQMDVKLETCLLYTSDAADE